MSREICPTCQQPLVGCLVLEGGAPRRHVVCPLPAEIARRRRLGRGPEHTKQLIALYPTGSRGRYV